MSGRKKKIQNGGVAASAGEKQNTESEHGPARIGASSDGSSSLPGAADSNSKGDEIIRDLPPPSETVKPRGAGAFMMPDNVAGAGAAAEKAPSDDKKVIIVTSHLEQPIPMTHSYSLPSLPTTSLRPRVDPTLVEGGGVGFHGSSTMGPASTALSASDLQYPSPAPPLSRTLSTPESSSSNSVRRSAFGRAGSAFGRFTNVASRPTSTYTQSDPGFSAFHPVTWNCQRSLSSAGSGSLVGSEIIEEHDEGSGLRKTRIASSPSNKMTRGFLLRARETLTKRRSGRENPARPSLSDTEDASSPPTTIITNDDGVEISMTTTEDTSTPPKIERVSPPSKIGLRRKELAAANSKPGSSEAQQHKDPGLELDFSDSDDEGTHDGVEHQPGVEVALTLPPNRPPSRADKKSQVPFDEGVQTYTHTATSTSSKTSSAGTIATKFKLKGGARRSKAVASPSAFTQTTASPHDSPNARTSSSSNGSPNSRGGLSTISSNSNSISSASPVRKINSTASSPGGGDSCAMNTTGTTNTDPELRDIVKRGHKKKKRQQKQCGKTEGNADDGYEAVSVDMDGNATVVSSSTGSCSSTFLREGAINPHIPGRAPSISPHRMYDATPFDEQISATHDARGTTDSPALKKEVGISKLIAFNSKPVVRSQSPHSTDAHTSSSASVSNATSSSSGTGGGSQQPVKFVAYETVEEREESPFDEHHHEENRTASHQTLIRPTISNGDSSSPGQRPPISPRKMMSVTPPPTNLKEPPLSCTNTPCSPPTIVDGPNPNVLVGDLVEKVESDDTSTFGRRASESGMARPKTRKLILVPPKISPNRLTGTSEQNGQEAVGNNIVPTVSPDRQQHFQPNINTKHLPTQLKKSKGGQDEVASVLVSPEKNA